MSARSVWLRRSPWLAQRGVQEMGGGVVAHGGQALGPLDHRPRVLARADLALQQLEGQRLIVAQPVHVGHPGPSRGRLHQAGVRYLTAALRVEGAFLELGQHPAVRALGHAEHGLRLGRLVAHEAGAKAGLAREAKHVLVLHVHLRPGLGPGARPAAARPRDLPRLLHQLLEALVVDGQAVVGKELLGHLVGKAVGVVQAEGVLSRDPGGVLRTGLGDKVGEQALALLQRAAEALLLGARPALDGLPLATEVRVGVPHQLHRPLVEPGQKRLA